MKEIVISDQIQAVCPQLCVAAISASVVNTEPSAALWREIGAFETEFRSACRLDEINKREPIRATRQAYKLLGKEPNRYRPSAEALCRRVVRALPLYPVSTLVDLINLISMRTGYSIGGFDEDKIQGGLVLGVGRPGEVFHGIGRGPVNIEGLPVYRDACSGVGTPTTDEERTKISRETTRLLMIINGYSGAPGLQEAVACSVRLLKKYVSARQLVCRWIDKNSSGDFVLNND